jgi:hypothetical protein
VAFSSFLNPVKGERKAIFIRIYHFLFVGEILCLIMPADIPTEL